MDFIERIFGVSPDGGSGAFELLLLAIPVFALMITCWVRQSSARRPY
jgi:hypothetical protein